MAREQGEEGSVVAVVGQEGTNALVSVPMVGFPEGFQLAAGARVVLVSTPSGPAARPLVRAVEGAVSPEALDQRGDLEVGGKRLVLQEATEIGEQPSAKGSAGEDVLWVIETGDREQPEQVVAVRRAGRS